MSTHANMTPEERHALLAQMPRKPRKPRQCEHIKANGEFCGSPALRDRHHCYFHLTHIGRKLRAERAHARAVATSTDAGAAVLELPPFEDANSIQVALMQVVDAILHNRLDTKRGGLVLYALQTASRNLATGADFRTESNATVVGRYDDFEEDFELSDQASELMVDEVGDDEQADSEHAAEVARAEELVEAYTRVGVARQEAEQRIIAKQEAGEDVTSDQQELLSVEGQSELFQCHPVEQLLCKIFGPQSCHASNSAAASRHELDACSQRLELRTARDTVLEKAA